MATNTTRAAKELESPGEEAVKASNMWITVC